MSVSKKKELVNRKEDVPKTWLLEALNLSKNALYYAHDQEERVKEDERIRDKINIIQLVFPYYGYKRIAKQFKRDGIKVNKKRIYRIMGEYHLLQPRKRKFNHPQTTNSRHKLLIYTNETKLLGPVVPGRVWVSDVTYVWCLNRWIYVAIVMDQSSRKVVGWSISKSLSRRLCIEALNMALSSNKAPEFHHSDRGVQYCSHDYINILKENNITPSMADVGMSVDNPHAEAFNRSFKVEEVYLSYYESFAEAKESITRYILCYNTKRLHSSIGYMPSVEFEAHYYLMLSKRDDIGVSN